MFSLVLCKWALMTCPKYNWNSSKLGIYTLLKTCISYCISVRSFLILHIALLTSSVETRIHFSFTEFLSYCFTHFPRKKALRFLAMYFLYTV